MSDEGSIMSDSPNSGNIEVILVRMEGKIDRFGDRMTRYETDINGIRQRIHDIGNIVQVLQGLNIPSFIADQKTHNAYFEERLKTLEQLDQQRKGAANLVKILWALIAFLGVGGIAAIAKVFGG